MSFWEGCLKPGSESAAIEQSLTKPLVNLSQTGQMEGKHTRPTSLWGFIMQRSHYFSRNFLPLQWDQCSFVSHWGNVCFCCLFDLSVTLCIFKNVSLLKRTTHHCIYFIFYNAQNQSILLFLFYFVWPACCTFFQEQSSGQDRGQPLLAVQGKSPELILSTMTHHCHRFMKLKYLLNGERF